MTATEFWKAVDLLTASINLFIAALVLTRPPRPGHRAFAGLTFLLSLWHFCHMMTFPSYTDPFWMRALFLTLLPLPALAVRFARGAAFARPSPGAVESLLAAAGAAFAATLPTPLFDTRAWRLAFIGFFFPPLLGCVISFVRAWLLEKEPARRNSLLYLVLGSAIAFAGGAMEFLPHFDVPIPLFPFGSLAIIVYTLLVAYAIGRHDLLSVAALARRTAFLAVLSTAVALAAAAAMTATRLLPGAPKINALLSLYALVPAAFWLWSRYGERLMAPFFEAERRREARLEVWVRDLQSVFDEEELTKRTEALVRDALGVSSYSLIVLPHGPATNPTPVPWARFFDSIGRGCTRRELDARLQEAKPPWVGEAAELVSLSESNGAQALVPVFVDKRVAALMLLGPARDGLYDPLVMEWLGRVAASAGYTLKSLRLQDELFRGDRLSQLGAMAMGIAHEIRNPLSSLKLAAELLGQDAVPAERKKQMAAGLDKEFDRLNALLDDIVSYGKPKPPRQDKIDAAALLDQTVGMLAPSYRGTVTLHWTRPPAPVELIGDPDQLRQIVINLVRFAERSMRKAARQDGRIALNAIKKQTRVYLQVADNGPGIPEEKLKTLFQPFTGGSEAGDGLGLPICERLTRQHGGRLWVQSQLDQGTVFTVELPENGAFGAPVPAS